MSTASGEEGGQPAAVEAVEEVEMTGAGEQEHQHDHPEFHYDSYEQVPDNIKKYWDQRYDLFSKYDEGVKMTDDAWFGVTPEAVADRIATHILSASPPSSTTLIDCFAGAGGNIIAFARHLPPTRFPRLFAIERDAATLSCARHNATLYNVAHRITFIHGDCFALLRQPGGQLASLLQDPMHPPVLFASPPWGGPGYRGEAVFDVNQMRPYGFERLYRGLGGIGVELVLFLPRTSDVRQVVEVVEEVERERGGMEGQLVEREGEREKIKAVHYLMWGASKALCFYFGRWRWEGVEW